MTEPPHGSGAAQSSAGVASGQPPTAPLSVPHYSQESTNESRRRWTRQQKRIYQRVQTMLLRWESMGYVVRWVMLSSSAASDPRSMADNHARLLRRIERTFGYSGIEYIVVQTAEGENVPEGHRGVLHALWAWRPPEGFRGKFFFVPQAWLSDEWRALHGASYVWIAPYKSGHRSRGRVSRYVVTQYCAGQDALVRFFWSWRRTFGLPVGRLWHAFVREYSSRGMAVILNRWGALITGQSVAWDRWVFTLAGLRTGRAFDLSRLCERPAPSSLLRRLGLSRA